MKLVGIIGTAVLSLTIVAPAYAQQEQHEQQEDQKDKPAHQEEKKTQPAKPARQQQEEKNAEKKPESKSQAKPEDKNAHRQDSNNQEKKNAERRAPESKPAVQQHASGGRIPQDRYQAHFGREHTFRVSQGDYRNHRFQYGGYWFGFVDPWPSNWLYTQDVFVVEINGVYYLCNPNYPGVNLAINVTL